jgi:hypothetical protein
VLPRFFEARMNYVSSHSPNLESTVRNAIQSIIGEIPAGANVALTCGSRGIQNIKEIMSFAVNQLLEDGYQPFLVTTMGSHGGGTVEGQLAVIANYGITEESMGVPIRATMEVQELDTTPGGIPVYFDKQAYMADAVIVVNRVKPHTTLRDNLGSGLMKMLVVGLGNQVGAESIHRHGLQKHLVAIARTSLERTPVIGGIAIIEDQVGQTILIEGVKKSDFIRRDVELLQIARSYMPRLPILPLDVLVVRKMGKNISGTGMDPNIIGLHRRQGGISDVDISTIIVLELTPETKNNATGVGMADLITQRLKEQINWQITSMNCLTGGFLSGMKLPFALPDDQQAIETAMQLHGGVNSRSAIIESTLHLEKIWLSENLMKEAEKNPQLEICSSPSELQFDQNHNLADNPVYFG